MPDYNRSHKVVIDVPEPKYRRWKYAFKNNKRVVLIDFRCIRSVPYKPVDYGARRCIKWNNPEQLQVLVDEYFESCFGPIRNPKTGWFYENPDGTLMRGQIKPFTISGLALYVHVATDQIKKYSKERIDALGMPLPEDYEGPTYSQIMLEAIRKIENYAEERLYDRDGHNGGRFVLDCAFGWVNHKESAEITSLKKQDKLKKKELKFRKQQAALDEDIEEPINITIKRAKAEEE